MLSCRRANSQQVSLGSQSLLSDYCFSNLNLSRQSRFSNYLSILYGTPLKNEREIKEILRVRKIIAEIKNSKVIKRN